MTNKKPTITCNANSRNRYNILAAVSLKRDAFLTTRVVEEVGDSVLFGEFVGEVMREGVLKRGDILVVDNCTIHIQAENKHLQEVLLMEHGILMITLPPYFAELNPTELVIRALLLKLRAIRCKNSRDIKLLHEVRKVLNDMSYRSIKSHFKECRYFIRKST